MKRIFEKKRFIKNAIEQGCVAEAVCIYKSKTFWSEMLCGSSWIKTFKMVTMYCYSVGDKQYFKHLKFRVSKEPDSPQNPYRIRIYYCKENPAYSHWEPMDETQSLQML